MQALSLLILKCWKLYLDGIFGTHRMFANTLGGFYTFVIDFFEILGYWCFNCLCYFFNKKKYFEIKTFYEA